eukprot:2545821-Ditylum_brightwellii.AAC.1
MGGGVKLIVARRDPLGNNVGWPLSMLMGGASEVVPVGYNDGSPSGVISGGRSSVRLYRFIS